MNFTDAHFKKIVLELGRTVWPEHNISAEQFELLEEWKKIYSQEKLEIPFYFNQEIERAKQSNFFVTALEYMVVSWPIELLVPALEHAQVDGHTWLAQLSFLARIELDGQHHTGIDGVFEKIIYWKRSLGNLKNEDLEFGIAHALLTKNYRDVPDHFFERLFPFLEISPHIEREDHLQKLVGCVCDLPKYTIQKEWIEEVNKWHSQHMTPVLCCLLAKYPGITTEFCTKFMRPEHKSLTERLMLSQALSVPSSTKKPLKI